MFRTKKIMLSAFAMALALCVVSFAGCGGGGDADTQSEPNAGAPAATEPSAAAGEYSQGIHHAILKVQGYEPIEIALDADAAPITVENFANLVQDGYYNGKTFYRFQDGFCMQGGTLGNSSSGSDPSVEKIVGEFSGNGRGNALADNFGRGVIAMARTTDPDSASTTFFVTLADGPMVSNSLNGQYAAFGTIDENGMAIVDQIVADHAGAADPKMGMVDDESQQAVIESIEMVD